ncbi:Rha family transcriptional regulator [Mesorhizobium tianshanense]|uniref:AlpA family transcriptional regulator n=1 Tax=Mesorhizobium tianshanense TaxID=39844 RepID=A0A562P3V8_9HYPH|nr:AlpA family transcriptional regulator [Mesorhizobium tianshanense]TWI39135.1 AlpA family transcriptional regulator [Mesorhizobium tianshanense]GLS41572.1 Rha family transcriptional regulator [Mesorhizobium tianshanense]
MEVQNIIRFPELKKLTGYPRSTLYAKIARGEFPKPVKLGPRSSGWLEQDVAKWQQKVIAASREVAA